MKTEALIGALVVALTASVTFAQQTDSQPADNASSMTQRLEEMQVLVEEMGKTNTAVERQLLVREHRLKMKDAMDLMPRMKMGAGQGKQHHKMKGMSDGGQKMKPMMYQMQAHHEKMMQTTDPVERQELMTEHRQKMQDAMAAMRSMDMKGRDSLGSEHHMMMATYQQMDKRLDIMQMLLQQALQQQTQ